LVTTPKNERRHGSKDSTKHFYLPSFVNTVERSNLIADSPSCFRSTIVSSCNKIIPLTHFFQERLARRLPDAGGAIHRPVALTIGVLSRVKTREILNAPQIMQTLLQSLHAVGITASSKLLFFEGRSFTQQASEMAQIDVLIASHGAGNANIIFMKKGSIFVEIIPFGLSASFKRLSRQAGLMYKHLVAEPHDSRVRQCAEKVLRNDNEFISLWEKSTSTLNRSHHVNMTDSIARRTCLRAQSLAVRSHDLADIVVSIVKLSGKWATAV